MSCDGERKSKERKKADQRFLSFPFLPFPSYLDLLRRVKLPTHTIWTLLFPQVVSFFQKIISSWLCHVLSFPPSLFPLFTSSLKTRERKRWDKQATWTSTIERETKNGMKKYLERKEENWKTKKLGGREKLREKRDGEGKRWRGWRMKEWRGWRRKEWRDH